MIHQRRKFKKVSYHRLIKKLLLFLLISLYIFWTAEQKFSSPLPQEGQPPSFFAGECDHQLCPLFRTAIEKANSSILLIIYNLSDKDLISSLEKQALKGLDVKVIVDQSSKHPLKGIRKIKKALSGLMHRKLLVIDQQHVFIGSANFTPESLHIDDNFVAAFQSKELSDAICQMRSSHCWLGGQRVDFYPLPEKKEEALTHLLHHLKHAKTTIKVAMFTLTHPTLIQTLIEAHHKGIKVEVALDRKSSEGASRYALKQLTQAGIPLYLSGGSGLFHHKLAIIDSKTIIFGSANWTRAAFTKNEEDLIVIDDLNQQQIEILNKLWHAIECTGTLLRKETSCLSSVDPSLIFAKNLVHFLQKTTLIAA